MKKLNSIILTAVMVSALTACGSVSNNSSAANNAVDEIVSSSGSEISESETSESEISGSSSEAEKPETITVTCLNGAGETVQVEVPYDPQRIAVVDMAMLDIIDNLGLGDRVVGSSTTALDYLQSYVTDDSIVNLGSIKEADMEALMECEPEIIFMGGRMSDSYDAFCEIAPVIRLTADTELGVLESTRQNAGTIASIFGKEDEVDAKFADFDDRITALREVAAGKTAVVGMCTSGSFNVVGDSGRCSVIGVEVGFENLCNDISSSGNSGGHGSSDSTDSESSEKESGSNSSNHGTESSFELIVSLAPDYIFVMDRDAAIGTNGAQLAKEVMENELIMSTDAYKNGNLVILEHPGIWYTAEGGITSFGIMLSDLESALSIAE
ncbi:MAG: ABC transporter substrate-binding protein [Lachnospiraceae bacterium]|nr:ABC transporter substrate-binding protein [Lachnospiraceae bacterium]